MSIHRETLLEEIVGYCRRAGIAESTFGRWAVNDGKFVSRLRGGSGVTIDTVERVRGYIAAQDARREARAAPAKPAWPSDGPLATSLPPAASGAAPASPANRMSPVEEPRNEDAQKNFRFFDNRQKYLLFVNTCSEKWVVAQRVSLELANIQPRPPAVRVFDAGVGDGTVLARVLRSMHGRFPTFPFYIVGKEISLEDVRLTLEKLPDRFYEHPASVIVLTNMYYAEAPWLTPRSAAAASSLVWKEVALEGSTASAFEEQITDLQGFLADNWNAKVSPKSGNPVYERPVALVLYREDHKFLLDQVRPKPGQPLADYDLVIASQPYRLKSPTEFKASKVIAPLTRALAPGGRLIGIHSYGNDPGAQIVRSVWPGENPFTVSRHGLLGATKTELGGDARHFTFNAYSDDRSIFRYEMHTLPNEVEGSIGTSTLFAAWNAAVYVAQIEEQRLDEVVRTGAYLEATGAVLKEHQGLWFNDESFVITRRRD